MNVRFALGLSALTTALVVFSCSQEERNFGEPLSSGGSGASDAGGSGGTSGSGGSGATGLGGQGQGGEPSGTPPTAVIEVTTDLVGLVTRLDASDSTGEGLTYSWTFSSVPAGSSVTEASLTQNGATATFMPDRGGEYEVELTVTDANDETATTSTTFTIETVEVPHFVISGNEVGSTRAAASVRSDGTGVKELGCFFTEAAKTEVEWSTQLAQTGQFDLDTFHPPNPSVPGRLAVMRDDPEDGPLLHLASGETSCSGAVQPAELAAASRPRFSPNGERVVFFIEGGGVATAASDGTGFRIVRPVPNDGTRLGAAPPFWVDNETVGWLELRASDAQQVAFAAPDETDGFLNMIDLVTLLNCGTTPSPFVAITQLVESAAGLVVAARPASTTAPTELFLLEPVNASVKYSCQRNSTSNRRLAEGMSGVQDFELSPDGTKVLFMRRLEADPPASAPDATELYVVPADGSAAPTKLVGDGSDLNNAAHWAANGRQVVWTRTVLNSGKNRVSQSSLMIINADGSNPRRLVHVESSVTTFRAVSTGANGCAFAPVTSGGAGGLALGLLGLLALRRGRRSAGRGTVTK